MIAGPIRGELLGAEHLAERARAVARGQRLAEEREGWRRAPLLTRLDATREILEDARTRLTAAANRDMDVGPAGEWLLDNYHVVQEHIGEVRESLPRGFYRELPELAQGPLAGYPRIYELGIALISHTEARIDVGNLDLFVRAFQEVAPLSIGELWALPAMLRLGLIESVRRMSLRTVQRLEEVESAVQWATSIQRANGHGQPTIGIVLERFITNHPPLTPIFVSQFVHHLRLAEGVFPPLMWLEQWMADEGLGADDAASQSTQRLALTQLMMANSITSLRAVAHMDWRAFVERHSVMEAALRDDPSRDYARMTFATRDRYRHVVERIAKRTHRSEDDVARQAVGLAREAAASGATGERFAHVGYYLVDEGLAALERATGYRPSRRDSAYRWVRRHPNVVFVGGVLSTTVAALVAVLWLGGVPARSVWPLVILLGLIPATEIAISVVNQLITAFMPPRVLPKLNLRGHGVPPEFRTAVVVPTLFGSVSAVREALDNLEVQFLANREAHLHFALLSDFTDAPTEHRDGDEAIVEAAADGVRALNARYASGTHDAFYLFHRPRRWNPQQGVWMGWERKRGKLAEFNRFLRGAAGDAFSEIVGDVEPLRHVRYVITLDSDTVLPPDAAPLLIGALAHPLNRAVYDSEQGRVVHGYGILQPRVGVSLPSAYRSRFAAIHSGHPGVDPYTTAVSDVYQDLYGEGSFTGKGIYDVDAFEQATRGRFPENTLLSHDLIEGNYARAGLATDITVYDDYPTRYLTFTRRKHRWIRGDWQLLGWLTPRVPGPSGPEPNRLSILSQWKILDNLRRSTVEIAQLLFLIAGWTILPGSPLRWTLLGLAAVAAPWIVSLLLALVRPPFDKSWRAYYGAVARDAVTSAQQVALAIAFLPHQAWVSVDAILRTLWRLFVSRRALLEWQTASQTERVLTGSAREAWRTMWPAVAMIAGVVVVAAAVELIGGARASGVQGGDSRRLWELAFGMAPLILLWIASPAIAHALNEPVARRERRLPQRRRLQAMRYALLHWNYFDTFVDDHTHWLAPDNYQEHPQPVIALRTSPTNIGLQLLATISAYDLGFITVEDLTRRLELTFRSLERMRRFRGHFYNWYDLRDLSVLQPAYISTVDSGNLAGHLIAVRQACLAIRNDPVFDTRVWRALETALAVTAERLHALASQSVDSASVREALVAADTHLRMADAEIARAAAETSVSDPLSRVAEPLQRALESLTSAGLSPDAVQSLTEWLVWSLRRIDEHDARVGHITGTRIPGRHGTPVATFPSPAELASRSSLALEVIATLEALADRAYAYAMEMDFGFLFDAERKLFAIGYQEATHSLDPSYYDLLASEARLASFVAVAKDEVPVEHWFRLGRTLTRAAGETALVSWSGSVFEYLMPALVMQSFPATVLDATYRGAMMRHIAYGGERGVPWGISESAYNLRDRHLTYQYRAFGVPDLALKRGLGRDLVVAPYASMLAALIEPQQALENLQVLERKGALGPHGFRDAVDYSRPDPGERYAIVQTYMAHHIGMGAVALTNVLMAEIWQRRFHADPLVRAAELLLHERIPSRLVLQEPQAARPDEALPDPELERPAVREINTPDTPQPHVALLGLLPYTIMVSSCGGGYSRYGDMAVTRWRADGTRDHTGQFCYLRDVTDPAQVDSAFGDASERTGRESAEIGRVWSAAHQPVCAPADWYSALLATDRVTFHRADGAIETRTEIAVMPEDSAEVRRVTVTNNDDRTREIELTSYGEIVLAPPDSERAHPAFANLFVETEWHEWCTAITATRRPRSATEKSLWCVHVVDACKECVGPVTCETDRARFIGRGRSTRHPIALETQGPLSGTTGAVLDPIFALRTRVRLRPGQSASVAFTTLVAATRELAFELADRYHDPHAAQRALDLAWTSTQVELRELGITPADAAVYQELASDLFYSRPTLRATQEELRRNRGSQPLLWADGISGDWPIVLATIDSPNGLPTLRQLLAAHHVWRRRGMTVDLVVLNTRATGYLQELGDRITEALFASSDAGYTDRPGGVFIRRADTLPEDRLLMLRATARVHVACDGRPLGRIVDAARVAELVEAENEEAQAPPLRRSDRHTPPSLFATRRTPTSPPARGAAVQAERPASRRETAPVVRDDPEVITDNGYGGITPEGDYAVRVHGDRVPPAPWANVIANPNGGFVVTERGAGFTWAANSHFYRLTPWHNDPVADPVGEAIYLRDEDGGLLWSATPAPVGHDARFTVRHGAGFTSFEQEYADIASTLTLGLSDQDATKISMLRLTNRGTRPRRLTVTAYVEWTLGVLREHTQHQILTTFDHERQAMLAQNFFDPTFADHVAFCAISEPVLDYTADRREFFGRNGSADRPDALRGGRLNGTTGAAFDPCSVLRCGIALAPGETREIVVVLGAGESHGAAMRALDHHREVNRAREAAARTVEQWTNRLSVITVRTPVPSFDAMLNRWTLYQALACRMWARSALYQSSGAYGFRDQLQDVMAFVYAEPGIARAHILRAAARQFVEGDVQHWWHPQTGRGVRTRFSDDLVWLPYVVDHYLQVTGDAAVLREMVPFLTMRALEPHEHEVYDLPQVSDERATVYEHCVRALRRACTVGENGLPLIGSGDWNDGMNRVGIEGRGESVWLGWFLITTLRAFARHADAAGDASTAADFRARAVTYAAAVEANGWDGLWYRRAYFDDGTPLGSSVNEECRIDSIAQSWSVISGAGDPDRQTRAMQSLEEHLVREDARLLMLLTPPFDSAPNDPGYIKGYLPGVRENGAQYTHAALWTVLATAMQGRGDRAFELYQMINPLTHAATPAQVETYKVEPYVVAADVYTAEGQLGRGGWTWYTGSASWMYRVGLESILGITKRGNTLTFAPRVPRDWPEFTVEYRFGSAVYVIVVHEPAAMHGADVEVSLDGRVGSGAAVTLVDDGARHDVVIRPRVAHAEAAARDGTDQR